MKAMDVLLLLKVSYIKQKLGADECDFNFIFGIIKDEGLV